VLTIVVMALSADLITLTKSDYSDFKFLGLALATSGLTLITIVPMYDRPRGRVFSASLNGVYFSTYRFIIDLCWQGAFFSYTVVEISWLCMFPSLAKF
jgi:hypothetical protein